LRIIAPLRANLTPIHEAQALTYLRLTGCPVALVINFNVPRLMDGVSSVWAQYTIRVPSGRRGALAAALKARGIPTAVFYAKPLHQQTAYQNCLVAGNGLPVTERIAGEVISLPMHAYVDESDQQRIIEAVKAELD